MAEKYAPQDIEPKWQQKWSESGLYATHMDPDRPKYYSLTMLPYPSGDLHIGHWYAMTPSDAAARYQRMRGHNVFFPIGFDAFGLPAENAAIKHGTHPYSWTMTNIDRMRGQLRRMGAMWAWDREAVSCDPRYYAWTQWFFRKLYDMGLAYRKFAPVDFCPNCNTTHAREQVWGEDRHCERCGTPVIKKELNQWFFKITDYADELLDFSGIEWPERIRTMQTNWIGRSEGAEVKFRSEQGDEILIFTTRPDTLWGATFMVLAPEHPLIDKLTTSECRSAVEQYRFEASRQTEIERSATDKEKSGVFIGAFAINPVNGQRIPIWIADYVMMGYGTGAIMAVPAHDERDFAFAIKFDLPVIPVLDRPDGVAKSAVWQGSVSEDFGDRLAAAGLSVTSFTIPERGIFWGVTLHGDEEVARYRPLLQGALRQGHWADIVGRFWQVVFADDVMTLDSPEANRSIMARCQAGYDYVRHFAITMAMWADQPFYKDVLFHTEYATLINSAAFTGRPGDVAKRQVIEWLAQQGLGKGAVNYRIRDWLISRQRYWGSPIPIIYCEKCGVVPVPYEDLPVVLPTDAAIPSTGENALKFYDAFRIAACPKCGGPAERETDTMDTFMCSSWYQYAYVHPYYKAGEPLSADDKPWPAEEGQYWLPVDQYTGGPEHATMHLLYTRFFTKAMRDMGVVPFGEPMLRLYNQGIILGPDGNRMSKSRGNVVAPDDWVTKYGADSVRAYLMFIGPWDMGGPWNFNGIEGVRRFLERAWSVVTEPPQRTAVGEADAEAVRELRHQTHVTIRRVTEDLDGFKFNTMLAALMEFNNTLVKAKETPLYGTPAWVEAIDTLTLLMAPSMPHVAEEMWQLRHGPAEFRTEDSVHVQAWPRWDPALAASDSITLVVQINGKVREKLTAPANLTEEAAKELALSSPTVQKWLEGKTVLRAIFAGGKLLSIVVK
jgi:leucyl-tRNA synthetase